MNRTKIIAPHVFAAGYLFAFANDAADEAGPSALKALLASHLLRLKQAWLSVR